MYTNIYEHKYCECMNKCHPVFSILLFRYFIYLHYIAHDLIKINVQILKDTRADIKHPAADS